MKAFQRAAQRARELALRLRVRRVGEARDDVILGVAFGARTLGHLLCPYSCVSKARMSRLPAVNR